MNIIVCVKQVPDTTQIKLNPETHTLIRDGVENILNPYDAEALETALILKDKYGAKVTVVTMGPPQAKEILKKVKRHFSILLFRNLFMRKKRLIIRRR